MIYDIVEDIEGRKDFDAYGLDDLAPTVADTSAALWKHRDEFDVILVTGMSGVVVGVPVALALNKPVAIVRKNDDDAHQSRVCGAVGGKRVINRYALMGKRALIVDDFRSTGDTEWGLIETAKAADATVVATYWYRDKYIEHHTNERYSGEAQIVDAQGEPVGEPIPF